MYHGTSHSPTKTEDNYTVMVKLKLSLSLVLAYVSRYRQEEETRKFIVKVMTLSLLPPDIIPASFMQLQKKAETSEARELMAYYNTHWVEKTRARAPQCLQKEVRTNTA